MKRYLLPLTVVAALVAPAAAAPAAAQITGRLSVTPFIGYGFYGDLPDGVATLESTIAYGGRGAYQISPQFSAFGELQFSNPEVTGVNADDATVIHWSGGVEFAYVPRGGAEGMLPVLLEAGVGQARYDFGGPEVGADVAVNLGIGSALQFTPNLAVRYGANDYISSFDGRGIVNQIFVRVGVELGF